MKPSTNNAETRRGLIRPLKTKALRITQIDYLYFNIYNYLYRISPFRQNPSARLLAMYLFSLGSGAWLLVFEALYLHLVRHSWFPSKAGSTFFAISVYSLSAVLSHYIFIVKDRALRILDKYDEL